MARVHGVATAAGCQLVAAADLAVAAESARFATPGVRIGLFCSTPMVPISRAVGRKRAMEMLLTGEMIDAQTALDWGLVNRVVPDEQLDQAVSDLIASILRYSPAVIGLGQDGLLSPGRRRPAPGLPANQRGHGAKRSDGRCSGRDRCLSRKAHPTLAWPLSPR